jgi:probable selenium-dependent hydroxylase accessory protein YqeC
LVKNLLFWPGRVKKKLEQVFFIGGKALAADLGGKMLFSKVLPVAPGTVVAVVGGGGKTGLIELWEGELAEAGLGVITSFTTRLERDRLLDLRKVRAESYEAALGAVEAARRGRRILLSGPKRGHEKKGGEKQAGEKREGKIWSLPLDWLDRLVKESRGELIWLIEADGSAGRPLKAHRPWEPVLPRGPCFVVMVMGLSALVRPWPESLHLPESLAQYLEPPLEERPLRVEEIVDFAVKAYGGLKLGAIFLNQADLLTELLGAEGAELGQALGRGLVKAGFRVIYGSLRERKFQELSG